LEKQPVIGTILPLFGGETVHTLSAQFPAKPLSTKTLSVWRLRECTYKTDLL